MLPGLTSRMSELCRFSAAEGLLPVCMSSVKLVSWFVASVQLASAMS